MAGLNLALPFLIINMGGEMIYILNQRLIAQKIPNDKGDKVRADVIKHMFSEGFVRELMVPQPLYSMTSTRQIFDKIAQSSIMKLQTSSMNKLFDLMLMGVKVQIMTLQYPEQLLRLTLNHILGMMSLISSKESITLLSLTAELLTNTYSSCSAAVYNRIRQALLRFFQNRTVKVTMYLHSGIQLQDGTIKINATEGIPLSETPGKIIKQGAESFRSLALTSKFKKSLVPSCNPLQAQTKLGVNLYDGEKQQKNEEEKVEESKTLNVENNRDAIAKWELNSLANMIYTSSADENLSINLFTAVDIEFKENSSVEVTGIASNSHLDKIINTLQNIEPTLSQNEEDDLMDLL